MAGERHVEESANADFYLCPKCGREVRVGSNRCLHCEPKRSWEQDDGCDGLDLADSDEDWDYDDFIRREFSEGGRPAGEGHLCWPWIAVGLGLVFVMLWLSFMCAL